MNAMTNRLNVGRTLIAVSVGAVLLAACATAPVAPEGAAEVRNRLTRLQSDPELASRAPMAMKDADTAVRMAEQPEVDEALGSHRVYIADRKVEIARAQASTRLSEDQRAALSAQSEKARLDSRTREADLAMSRVETAQAATADAERETAELQRRVDELQAKITDRGIVLTLGDVLFASGSSTLQPGSATDLDQLVAFLGKYPTRTVTIEGHTDSAGTEEYNQGLSERRAYAVRSHLVMHGVDAARITAVGVGESAPVAGNESATGRQRNRRVEVIISNTALATG